jgi:hypothetical protein
MQTILLTHIVLMCISIVLAAGILGATLLSKRVSTALTQISYAVTAAGLGCGVILLASNPVDSRCLVLGGYLLAFIFSSAFVSRRQHSLQSV